MILITPKKGFEINEDTEASHEEIKIDLGALKQADNYLMVIRNTTSINTSCKHVQMCCVIHHGERQLPGKGSQEWHLEHGEG